MDDRIDRCQHKSALVLHGSEVVRLDGNLVGGLPEVIIKLLLDMQVCGNTLSQQNLFVDGELEVVLRSLHGAVAVRSGEWPHRILEQHQV